jgi:hypothetical protein
MSRRGIGQNYTNSILVTVPSRIQKWQKGSGYIGKLNLPKWLRGDLFLVERDLSNESSASNSTNMYAMLSDASGMKEDSNNPIMDTNTNGPNGRNDDQDSEVENWDEKPVDNSDNENEEYLEESAEEGRDIEIGNHMQDSQDNSSELEDILDIDDDHGEGS